MSPAAAAGSFTLARSEATLNRAFWAARPPKPAIAAMPAVATVPCRKPRRSASPAKAPPEVFAAFVEVFAAFVEVVAGSGAGRASRTSAASTPAATSVPTTVGTMSETWLAFAVSAQYTPNAPITPMPASPHHSLRSASSPTKAPMSASSTQMPRMSSVLSFVPALRMPSRFSDSGVRVMMRLPTAMSGDAAGRTNAATVSPTPMAIAADRKPISQPRPARERIQPSSQRVIGPGVTEP